MTKEKLYKQLCECGITDGSPLACAVRHEFSKFFDSNVCIPKGDNRVDCADIWHQIIEGADFQTYRNSVDEWKDDEWISLALVRIKPSEPIYEWQWLVMHHQAYVVSDYGRFMTLEETCDGMMPIEETKRVRRSE